MIDDFYVDEADVIDALMEPLKGRAPLTAARSSEHYVKRYVMFILQLFFRSPIWSLVPQYWTDLNFYSQMENGRAIVPDFRVPTVRAMGFLRLRGSTCYPAWETIKIWYRLPELIYIARVWDNG